MADLWLMATGRCKRLRLGSLLLGPMTTSNDTVLGSGIPTDSLVNARQHMSMSQITTLHDYAVEWSNEKQVCLATGGQRVVLWASGASMQVQLCCTCCTLFGALTARWYGFAPDLFSHGIGGRPRASLGAGKSEHGRGREMAYVQRE